MSISMIKPSSCLSDVKYEIRGPLAKKALQMEKEGYEILKLNIGNPGYYGFRTPEAMRLAIIENLQYSEAYCHSKGIFPAREAVVMQQQERGIMDVTVEEVFMGNGVSELIMMSMRALINTGDEILVPVPDYPLWTASIVIHGGIAVPYSCLPENQFLPDIEEMKRLLTKRTKGIIVINPNNPTGAVYPKKVLKEIVQLAETYQIPIFSDEIYDQVLFENSQFTPMATLVKQTLCVTFSGLSKVYRACGFRIGWLVFSGERKYAQEYMNSIEFLASLRLCSNVPAQWAVQTALGGYQSIQDLVKAPGRLYESRKAVLEFVKQSKYLSVIPPKGAIYAFIKVNTEKLQNFHDEQFALDLLEQKHVLVVPGSSFNISYTNHFRITLLPRVETLKIVFERIEELLDEYCKEKICNK